MQMQPTLAVANYLIGKAHAEGRSITPMQLIKLVYIAHGWTLGLYGKPLIGEEVQAWKYGPVVPSVYQDFGHYRGKPIERQKVFFTNSGQPVVPTVLDPLARGLLDKVWEKYRSFDGVQLSSMTHQPGTPWHKTWEEKGAKFFQYGGIAIPQTEITSYYKTLSERKR